MKQRQMKNEVIKTSSGEVWLGEDGILRQTVKEGSILELENAIEDIKVYSALSHGKKRPLFIDISNVKSVSREARSYYAGDEGGRFVCAVALLIGSHLSRIIGNFFLGFNKTSFPLRLFTAQEEAIQWLKGFLQ